MISKNINFIKKSIIVLIIFSLLITITAYFTYEQMQSKMYIDASSFNGTYMLKDSGNIEYICIMKDADTKLKNTYLRYDASETYVNKGTCNKTNNNYATLYEGKDIVKATIVYSVEDYFLIENGKEASKLTKISNEVIAPSKEF